MIIKIEEKLAKSQAALNKSLVNGFACENDARLVVERWLSKHKRYILSDIEITCNVCVQDIIETPINRTCDNSQITLKSLPEKESILKTLAIKYGQQGLYG